jgi:hypothetical protein
MKSRKLPTTAELDEFMALSGPVSWPELTRLAETVEPGSSGAEEFFVEWRLRIDELSPRVRSSAVFRWLHAQSEYRRAIRVALGQRGEDTAPPTARNEDVQQLVHRAVRSLAQPSEEEIQQSYRWVHRRRGPESPTLEEWAAQVSEPNYRLRSFRSHLARHASFYTHFPLPHGVTGSLRNYFASDAEETARRIESARQLDEALGRLAAAAVSLQTHHTATPASSELQGIARAVDRAKRAVARQLRQFPPSIRRDPTLPERVLLWELRGVLEGLGMSSNATALYHFLCIDGVRHSLDLRTVQRLLAKWR